LEKILIKSSYYFGNSTQIEVCSLKYMYKNFAWLFARINGQESVATIPRYVFYVLHQSFHEDVMFDWAHIISSEVSFQLGNFQKTKNFFMTSYLVYAISYYHIFDYLSWERNVDFSKDPVQFWYPTLWKHKALYHFYEVHNSFLSTFKKLIHGSTTLRL